MFPCSYSLEEAAKVVWEAATKGRSNARNGFRASATAFMEGLYGIRNEKYPRSLRVVAHSAADDINKMLNGEASASGGSAA